MNFSLPKIKFPFKKVKNVCTTEQVIHRVDGQDKKLSDVLNSYDKVPITINGKSPIEYTEDMLALICLAVDFKQALDEAGIYCLYPNKPVNIEFKMFDKLTADVEFQGLFYGTLAIGIEQDAESGNHVLVVGELTNVDKNPEHIRSFITYQVEPCIRAAFEASGLDTIQAIFDYFNAQLINNQNN